MTRTVLAIALLAGSLWAGAGQGDAPGADEAMPARLAERAPMTALIRTGDALLAAGDYGIIIRSTDSGDHWQQAQVPFSGLLTALHCRDDGACHAVGHGGVVLSSGDGGARWQVAHTFDDAPVLLSVLFADADHGYVTGAYGVAWRTRDGGRSWAPMTVGSGRDGDLHLNQIAVLRDGSLVIAAEAGRAFLSRDGGDSWRVLETGASGSLWAALDDGDGGFALLGMSGRLLTSGDHGAHWDSRIAEPAQSLAGAALGGDGRLRAVGNGGLVVTAGRAALRTQIRDDRQNLAAIAQAPDGTWIAAGQQGVQKVSMPD